VRRAEDVPLIAAASHDPETRRRMEDEPMTPERERSSLARTEEQWRSGAAAPFVIADASSDRALGLVNLQFGEDATLAVSVFPAERGRGIASRAMRLAATWGLRDLGLRRVVAEAAADNVASIRAIEKAGFRREGLRDDQARFVLLPEDVD
jgi:RimJ/RimL family protein N-acetyltransferase